MVVSFDAYGTLFEESKDHYGVLLRMTSLSKKITVGEFREAIDREYAKYLGADSHNQVVEFWRELYGRVVKSFGGDPAVSQQMISYTSSSRAWQVDLRTTTIRTVLRNRFSVRLIVCSDWDDSLNAILSGLSLLRNFKEVYTNSTIHIRKELPTFWEEVLQRENISAEELVHVGDDIKTDREIPSKLGIRTVLVSEDNVAKRVVNFLEDKPK